MLAGLAPVHRHSGQMRGARTIKGGRSTVRRQLYKATPTAIQKNPVIRARWLRLTKAGKPGKVAITAWVRKLIVIANAMIRDKTPWNPATAGWQTTQSLRGV